MQSLLVKDWRLLLFGFLMTFFSFPGQTFFISLFSGEIRAELSLSNTAFSTIYSGATLCSALVMVWTGTLSDKVNLKILALMLVMGLAMSCGLIAFSQGVIMLVIAIFFLRHIGQGLMCLVSATSMVRYLAKSKGKASALAGMGYAVSEAILPVLLVVLMGSVGWRECWQLIVLVLILFMLPMVLILLRNHEQRHQQYLSALDHLKVQSHADLGATYCVHWTRKDVLKERKFYLFMPALLSQPLMFTGFIFHQVHMVNDKQWPLAIWTSFFALYAMVSVVSKLLAGWLVDMKGAVSLVPFLPLPMAFGLVVLSFAGEVWQGSLFLVLMGVTVGFQSTVLTPFLSDLYGTEHLGSIKSLCTAAMVFSTAISPVCIGVLLDLGVNFDQLALYGALYVFLVSYLAFYAYKYETR